MIIVTIYNKCEIELNANDVFSEDFKLFKYKYSKNIFDLTFKSSNIITKLYVDSLVAPDFECISADLNEFDNKIVLYFDRCKTKNNIHEQSISNIETKTESDNSNERVDIAEDIVETNDNAAVEQTVVKKPRARRRTKAEMLASYAENAKRLVGLSNNNS